MGQEGAPIGEVYLEQCRVPAGAIIGGEPGRGVGTVMKCINKQRINLSALSTGPAMRLLELQTRHRALDRKIQELHSYPYQNQILLQRLKKEKLRLKDAIERKLMASVRDISRIITKTRTRDKEQEKKYNALVKTMIEENGYCESFNGRMSDELLNG
mgnify:CR=1 FL=1